MPPKAIDWPRLRSLEPLEGPALESALAKRGLAADPSGRWPRQERSVTLLATGSVKGMPALPKEEELRELMRVRSVPWFDKAPERLVRYWASDERVDRAGDIVRQNFDFTDFARNPVMPFGHDYAAPPVGVHLDWRVLHRADEDYSGPALYLLSQFAPPDVDARADSVFRLVRSGVLRGGSIGFIPKTILTVKDPDERAELGLGPLGVVFESSALLEFSACSIGCNPGALAVASVARKRGLFREEDVDVLRAMAASNQDSGARQESQAAVLRLARAVFPKRSFPSAAVTSEDAASEDAASTADVDGDPQRDAAPSGSTEDPIQALRLELEAQRAELEAIRVLLEQNLADIAAVLAELRESLDDVRASASPSAAAEEPTQPEEPRGYLAVIEQALAARAAQHNPIDSLTRALSGSRSS